MHLKELAVIEKATAHDSKRSVLKCNLQLKLYTVQATERACVISVG